MCLNHLFCNIVATRHNICCCCLVCAVCVRVQGVSVCVQKGLVCARAVCARAVCAVCACARVCVRVQCACACVCSVRACSVCSVKLYLKCAVCAVCQFRLYDARTLWKHRFTCALTHALTLTHAHTHRWVGPSWTQTCTHPRTHPPTHSLTYLCVRVAVSRLCVCIRAWLTLCCSNSASSRFNLLTLFPITTFSLASARYCRAVAFSLLDEKVNKLSMRQTKKRTTRCTYTTNEKVSEQQTKKRTSWPTRKRKIHQDVQRKNEIEKVNKLPMWQTKKRTTSCPYDRRKSEWTTSCPHDKRENEKVKSKKRTSWPTRKRKSHQDVQRKRES